MSDEIPLGRPTTGDEEVEAVREVLESGWVAGQGPAGRAFEAAFAATVGAPHAKAVNNCTAGLHLAYLALGAGPGDEVIVADYTYPATAHAVLYCGATPRFADVKPNTGLVDPASVEALVGERTVGIVGVDTLGQPADWDELGRIAEAKGLWLVEDAACSAGASYGGRPAGHPGLADAATFSLHGRKGITSGEGGVVTTGRDDVDAFVGTRLSFGVESALSRSGAGGLPIPVFANLGWNYKMSDIASAIAHVQLGRLDGILAARSRAAAGYAELLGGTELLELPVVAPGRTHPWQTYAVTVAREVDRGRLAMRLREQGIGCNIGTFACHLQPLYESDDVCETSADVFERHLAIPMHGELSESDVERVAKAVLDTAADCIR
ncbi:MAG: DegT/DnrJ/EryC1/StrS family aminotransferase [Actinomycetia bacterium]|nr:DegT/DnrJ/EryC1/StrS family aminotransferase [Actinomycetes bacterium]